MASKLKQPIKLAPEWILMITAVIIRALNSLTDTKYMYCMKTMHLFAKYTTQSDSFNMFMRILTFKYIASFGITSSRMILEQGTLASLSLFKHKKVSEAIFSIMDLGKMCEIQSLMDQWINGFRDSLFLFSPHWILSVLKKSLEVKPCINKSAVSILSCHTKFPRASTSSMPLWAEYMTVKVFLLELLVWRMIMWEHFPQHLETVNIAFYISQRTLKWHLGGLKLSTGKWYRRPLWATKITIGKPSIHFINLCTADSPLTIMGPESETIIPVICCADAAIGTFGST